MEKWKAVPFYEGEYEASADGQVRYTATQGIVEPFIVGKANDTPVVRLNHKGTQYTVGLHRVIAMTFVPNYGFKTVVRHVDGDNLNNTADNLVWTSRTNNLISGENTYHIDVVDNEGRIIYHFDQQGELISTFDGLEVHISQQNFKERVAKYLTPTGAKGYYNMSLSDYDYLHSEDYEKLYRDYIKKVKSSAKKGKGKVQRFVRGLTPEQLSSLKEDVERLSVRKFQAKYKMAKKNVVKVLSEQEVA